MKCESDRLGAPGSLDQGSYHAAAAAAVSNIVPRLSDSCDQVPTCKTTSPDSDGATQAFVFSRSIFISNSLYIFVRIHTFAVTGVYL